jgi:parallel beta-helix repeat protein
MCGPGTWKNRDNTSLSPAHISEIRAERPDRNQLARACRLRLNPLPKGQPMKRRFYCRVIILFFCRAPAMFAQGPLVPPGPPGPIMKTLEQIEPRIPISSVPFIITTPGSYYLTTNVTGGTGNGITISNSDVTVDLNGFVLRGGTGSGIATPLLCSNIWIRNGTVRDWGLYGISNGLAMASGVENIAAISNGRDGIRLGTSAVVRACIVMHSGDSAIQVGPESRIENCTVSSNAAGQIINLGSRSQIRRCVVTRNVGDGINTSDGCRVSECTSSANSRGILVGNSSVVEKCTVQGNSSIGIRTFNFTIVRDCLVTGNGNDGIFAVTHNVLVNNHCSANGTNAATGGAGIHMAGGAGTRIEDNTVNNNSWGIRVDTTNNIVIRNIASINDTNYFIVTSNKVGTIISAPLSGAISGSSGGAGVGTTDPWANLSF